MGPPWVDFNVSLTEAGSIMGLSPTWVRCASPIPLIEG